jgi:hypothetical protein
MADVFEKMQLKDRKEIVVLNAPKSFEPELAKLKGVTVHRTVPSAREIEFLLTFVMTQPDVDAAVKTIASRTIGDAVVWFAYPKASSKRYTSTINRDSGWDGVGAAGFEGVRMIAIDEDWTAVRFRRADFIKTMKRNAKGAMSAVGKARVARKKG